jgi:hypothetical protein
MSANESIVDELGGTETSAAILQMAAEDQLEEGDSGDSDVEGGEVNFHSAMPPTLAYSKNTVTFLTTI